MVDQKHDFLFAFVVHILLKIPFVNSKICFQWDFFSVDEGELVSVWNVNKSGVYGIY